MTTSLRRGLSIRQPTGLLTRILEQPRLAAAVRELPGAALGKLIDWIGLEDAGELVALASTAQVERIFDDDLWQPDRWGPGETFRPERFALWLRVLLEGGEDLLVQRLCELPRDLVVLAVHRLVLVLDTDVLAEQLSDAGEEAASVERALENSTFEEWEEFRLIARQPDCWDDVWTALLSLDRDHHELLRATLEQCCAMSREYISGQGGLLHVLTSAEALDGDVAAAREDRRSAQGFISAADARAFLQLARQGGSAEKRDPITRAYFRNLEKADLGEPAMAQAGSGRPERRLQPAAGAAAAPADADVWELVALLGEAELFVTADPLPLPALASDAARTLRSRQSEQSPGQSQLVAPLFEQAMSHLREQDARRFSVRVQELGYLVNVWMTGGAQQGRRQRPTEALEGVLRACEEGMRAPIGPSHVAPEQALSVLVHTPVDVLFRRGFRRAAFAIQGSERLPSSPASEGTHSGD